MKNWIHDVEASVPMERAGWPTTNIHAAIERGASMYQSMIDLTKMKQPSRSCQADPSRIKFLLSKRDIFSIQEAGILIEKCPMYFMDNATLVVSPTEDLDDAEDYVFRSDGIYIKASKNIGNVTILKEGFVGLLCLNHLRVHIPNFACILGSWMWQKPIGYRRPDGQGHDSLLTSDPRLVSEWIAYEEIRGVSLAEYIKVHKGADLKNILWQIGNALKLAYQTHHFYHSDLHAYNIVLTPLHHRYTYSQGRTVRHCDTNLVAVIIDYGRSSCIYQGVQYAKWWELEDEALAYDSSVTYPIRDMIFLLSSIVSLREYMEKVFVDSIKQMLSFCETASSISDLDILLSEIAPKGTEYVYPSIEVREKANRVPETMAEKTSRYLKQVGMKIDDDSNEEDVVAYGASLLWLLEGKHSIGSLKNTLSSYLGVLDRISYKRQVVYDLYVSLSKYR